MAMRKDRTRRYQSAMDLKREVESYLQNRPLLAGPESWTYRTRKAISKYRTPLSLAALFVLLLVGGIVGTTWQMLEAQRQRERVLAAQKGDLDFTRSVLSTLIGKDAIRRYHDPTDPSASASAIGGRIDSTQLEQQLLNSFLPHLQQLDGQVRDSAPVRLLTAVCLRIAGAMLVDHGRVDEGIEQLNAAKVTLSRMSSPDALDELASVHNTLGVVLHNAGRPEARPELTEAVRLRSGADETLDPTKRYEQVAAKVNLANLDMNNGSTAPQAEQGYRDAAHTLKQLADASPNDLSLPFDLAIDFRNLGSALSVQGNYLGAIDAYKSSEAILLKLESIHPANLQYIAERSEVLHNQGTALYMADRSSEAGLMLQHAVEMRRRLATDEPTNIEYPVNLVDSLGWLGQSQFALKNNDEARSVTEEAMRIARSLEGRLTQKNQKSALASILATIAWLQVELGDYSAANESGHEALNASPVDYRSKLDLAHAQLLSGDEAAAKKLYLEIIAARGDEAITDIRDDFSALRKLKRGTPSMEAIETLMSVRSSTQPATRQ